MGVAMTKGRGVAILVGAGDAIGAAVARRFA
jgi:NAD(P)-dependent dehydrogenase (short-subunit alcohol dehydrogenase family)